MLKKTLIGLGVLACAACQPSGPAVDAKAPAQVKMDALSASAETARPQDGSPSEEDKDALHSLGYSMGNTLKEFELSAAELQVFQKGFDEGVAKDSKAFDMATHGPRINAFVQKRNNLRAEGEKKRGSAFAEKAAQEEGAVKSESGLIYKSLKEGEGAQPTAMDIVQVHYKGTLIDGTEFDSSYSRNEPATFPLRGVIPCWTEGVQKMKVGGKAKLVCPSDIAYGNRGRPKIPGGATLVFEVELLEIKPPPPPKPVKDLPQAPPGMEWKK